MGPVNRGIIAVLLLAVVARAAWCAEAEAPTDADKMVAEALVKGAKEKFRAGEHEDAAKLLVQALKKWPGNAEGVYLLAQTQEKLGDEGAAAKLYTHYLKLTEGEGKTTERVLAEIRAKKLGAKLGVVAARKQRVKEELRALLAEHGEELSAQEKTQLERALAALEGKLKEEPAKEGPPATPWSVTDQKDEDKQEADPNRPALLKQRLKELLKDEPAEAELLEFDEHHYALIPLEKSWQDAQKTCESLGGNLVVPGTKEENLFIYGKILKNAESSWLGLVKPKGHRLWQCVTGERPLFRSWGEGEPNEEGAKEAYVFMGHWRNMWTDRADGESKFICEWGLADGKGAAPALKTIPKGRAVELLELVDVKRHAVIGQWERTREGLQIKPTGFGRIVLPVAPEGDYRLRVEFVRLAGKHDAHIAVFLPVGTNRVMLILDFHGSGGFLTVGGAKSYAMGGRAPVANLENGRPHVVEIQVMVHGNSAKLEATYDGGNRMAWQGKTAMLDLWTRVSFPDIGAIGLASNQCLVVFKSAKLQMVSGQAVILQ